MHDQHAHDDAGQRVAGRRPAAVAPERREEHDHGGEKQLIEGVHEEYRRRHDIGQGDDQQPQDAQSDEERQRGRDADDQPPPCRRIGTDGRQIDRDQRRGNALLRDQEAAARRPEHVGRGVRADAEDAQRRGGRAGDEAGQREDAGALEIERRGGQEDEQKRSREPDESSRRLRRGRAGAGGERRVDQPMTRRAARSPADPAAGRRSARRIHANTYPAIASVSTAGQT